MYPTHPALFDEKASDCYKQEPYQTLPRQCCDMFRELPCRSCLQVWDASCALRHLLRNDHDSTSAADFFYIFNGEVIIMVVRNKDKISILRCFPQLERVDIYRLATSDPDAVLGKYINVINHLHSPSFAESLHNTELPFEFHLLHVWYQILKSFAHQFIRLLGNV